MRDRFGYLVRAPAARQRVTRVVAVIAMAVLVTAGCTADPGAERSADDNGSLPTSTTTSPDTAGAAEPGPLASAGCGIEGAAPVVEQDRTPTVEASTAATC